MSSKAFSYSSLISRPESKLESCTFTFCYPVPRTLQNLKINGLHKNLNTLLARERIVIEHVNRRLKIFRILAERYRNRRRRFGLRCNLIAALYNFEQSQVA